MNRWKPLALAASLGLLVGGLALAPSADHHGPVFPDDFDGDGILDEFDNCVEHWNGLPDAPVAPPPRYFIRCGPQEDTDGDGFGDVCDTDYNNDWANGIDDCSAMLVAASNRTYGTEMDINCDGGVGLDDLTVGLFDPELGIGNVPGPSGLDCSGANQKGTCPPVVSW